MRLLLIRFPEIKHFSSFLDTVPELLHLFLLLRKQATIQEYIYRMHAPINSAQINFLSSKRTQAFEIYIACRAPPVNTLSALASPGKVLQVKVISTSTQGFLHIFTAWG